MKALKRVYSTCQREESGCSCGTYSTCQREESGCSQLWNNFDGSDVFVSARINCDKAVTNSLLSGTHMLNVLRLVLLGACDNCEPAVEFRIVTVSARPSRLDGGSSMLDAPVEALQDP